MWDYSLPMPGKTDQQKLPASEVISAWKALVRIETRIMADVQEALKAKGLPPLAWYDVLYELYKAGSGGLRQFELCEKVLISKYNLSRLIRKLEQDELLSIASCDDDGRGNLIAISEKGRRLIRQMWPVYGEVLASKLGSTLSPKELASFTRLLRKVESAGR